MPPHAYDFARHRRVVRSQAPRVETDERMADKPAYEQLVVQALAKAAGLL
jgi:hypothetical protein